MCDVVPMTSATRTTLRSLAPTGSRIGARRRITEPFLA
jgi:hypothetical protein